MRLHVWTNVENMAVKVSAARGEHDKVVDEDKRITLSGSTVCVCLMMVRGFCMFRLREKMLCRGWQD